MSSRISFDGRVVVITGAGAGLGREHALDLARRGASVVVNDIASDGSGVQAADRVVAEIEAAGGTAVASHDSIASADGGRAVIDLALDRFGCVDAVVHNAGTWRHVPYEEMTPDQLDPVLDVHLRGAVFVTRPAWSVMKQKGYGRIVLTSSAAGAFGREWGANYAAAKAGLLGLGRALALEGGRHGIRTNCLLPIARPMQPAKPAAPPPRALVEQLMRSGLKKGFPPQATAERVTPMLAWLASAACTVNGEAFSAGSGRYARVFIGLCEGWLAPNADVPTPEDIADHLDEIENRDRHTVPEGIWDELREIGRAIAARDGIDDLFDE
jgi:NAD(P)-dependent dehydrogenase (short-subunit alcohol dehydrogenase family)